MCTSKPLFAIALTLVLGACSSGSDRGTYYDVLIDSYSSSPPKKGETFYVSAGTEVLAADQLRFNTVAQVLEKALVSEGLTQSEDAKSADLQIALFYDLKAESDSDDYQIPAYTNGIPGSMNPGRTIHSGLQKAVIPIVRPKYVRFVVATAFMRKERKIVWETIIMSRGDSDDLMHVSPILVAAGRTHYGYPTDGRVTKTAWDSDSSIRSLISP